MSVVYTQTLYSEGFDGTVTLKGFLLALQFLTILPVRLSGSISGRDVGRSTAFFPLAGLIKGGLLVLAYAAFDPFLPSAITAALLLIVSVLINGGFHLDGLADTFDAIASGKPRQGKLDIMKDSTTGPIGVTAIVLVLLLKYLLILDLFSISPIPYLLLFPVIGAWSIMAAIFHGRSARKEGLGYLLIKETGGAQFVCSAVIVMVIFVSGRYLLNYLAFPSIPLSALFVTAVYLFTLPLIKFFGRHFSGLTGDNLGAICELNEVFFLLIIAVVHGG
ncbi:MAG TPA: adenosylcobinamide-GDP ribazoletransferase [Nitrospirae bacterium]|nr:adenosylcobinamide-GDP ribazoletransferase [Nitrospirota bacterium]